MQPRRRCLVCKTATPAAFWCRYPAGWLCNWCSRRRSNLPLLARIALWHGWWLMIRTEVKS